MRLFVFLPLAAVLLLGACNRDTAGNATADAGASPPATATATAPSDNNDAGVTMRYACDGDTSVAILGSDSARVDLPDGPDVTLSRIAGSAPPVFTGDELYFAIGDSGAHLSRGDETNELTCQPQ